MSRKLPIADQHPSHLPVPDSAAMASPALGSWSGHERLRFLWYRLRLAVAEMNYATRRMTDLRGTGLPDDRPVA